MCFPRFILTMRNVNIHIEKVKILISGSFILTMRNVNEIMLIGTFYILLSFILTMRNVNEVIGTREAKIEHVLY